MTRHELTMITMYFAVWVAGITQSTGWERIRWVAVFTSGCTAGALQEASV